MSCDDHVARKDFDGNPLPARQKSALSDMNGQTAARRVQFFSGKDIDIEDVNRRRVPVQCSRLLTLSLLCVNS
jgi:hypothetical protein